MQVGDWGPHPPRPPRQRAAAPTRFGGSAPERRGNNLTRVKDFYLALTVLYVPYTTYMCAIYDLCVSYMSYVCLIRAFSLGTNLIRLVLLDSALQLQHDFGELRSIRGREAGGFRV